MVVIVFGKNMPFCGDYMYFWGICEGIAVYLQEMKNPLFINF
jgi:hypothetical protein